MKFYNNKALAGASVPTPYFIDRSLRFRSSASAYLSRTPASAGNRKTWTWSGWVKRGALSSNQRIFEGFSDSSNFASIVFGSSDSLQIVFLSGGSAAYNLITTQVFRDVSSWYHICVVVDTTQATPSNTIKVYVNGEQVTAFGTATYGLQNFDTQINNTVSHSIGRYLGGSYYLDGYITETYFIDGQALDPTSFGEYNSYTGVWQPIKYTGTYGTNGFYLNFSDNSTTTTLGYDYSGNSNNFTANNVSLTSGTTYDSMRDVPTLTSEDAANFATINPLSFATAQSTISNGNLAITTPIAGGSNYATFNFPTTGKWYAEYACTAGTYYFVGVQKPLDTNKYVYYYHDGRKYIDGVFTSYNAAYATNDVIGVAVNCDDNEITFYKNGVSQGAISYTLNTGDYAFGFIDGSSSDSVSFVANFGATPFAYTPPTGFKSLNTYNLPDSTIVDGSQYFDVLLETGTGSARNVTGLQFAPDFLWAKGRNASSSHLLYDTVRGVDKSLNTNNALGQDTTAGQLTSFNSNGYSLPNDSAGYLNFSGRTYAFWNWKANGSGVTNNEGTIESTVSANTTAGFSIVTYTGTGVAGTVGHGLGVTPSMIIVKKRNDVGTWFVNHSSLTATQNLYLQTPDSVQSDNVFSSRSSTTFGITSSGGINAGSDTFVSYCFTDVEGYSKCGSYTGNGSATGDGPFVYTNFRPAFLLLKCSSTTGHWVIVDAVRNTYNVVGQELYPSLPLDESTDTSCDFLSNGFKLRVNSSNKNSSGATYIYAAFAENPFKNALAR